MSQAEASQVVQAAEVVTSPHLAERAFTSRRMMLDVLIALLPAIVVAAVMFRWAVAKQLGIALGFGLATEWLFCLARGKPFSLLDGSAAVTVVIFALSLPPGLGWYATAIGAVVAIGLGKMVFGGLGCNLFNPAMVGRAFLMACFPAAMVTWTPPALRAQAPAHAVTQATPLGIVKFVPRDEQKARAAGFAEEYAVRERLMAGRGKPILDLLTGVTGGSLGETSAIALLIGGVFLLLRGSASWQIPAGMLGTMAVIALIGRLIRPEAVMSPISQLLAGGAMLGAFFIATDPVTSPVTARGRLVFGIGVGAFTMLIRLVGGYPEGVMYAVLLMNAATPLINRATVPKPLGGVVNG